MQNPPSFAYSLSQVEEGWRWSVYDEDGVTIARGADVSRDCAQAAVELTLRRGSQRAKLRSTRACGAEGSTAAGPMRALTCGRSRKLPDTRAWPRKR